jgi:TolB-like protein/predicted Ser/Thr protein kinase
LTNTLQFQDSVRYNEVIELTVTKIVEYMQKRTAGEPMRCSGCGLEADPDSRFCPRCGTSMALPDSGAPDATRTLRGVPDRHLSGRTVGGRYHLLDILGRGGMGIVFKAEDTKLRRTVALKFLPAEIGQDAEAKKRFLREAQASAVLDHPNICPIFEVDESEGEMFLTMAFIEGRSLKERIAEGPLPIDEALEIAAQVAAGLQAAHEKGVVHRDIKPANIMINREGQARIMDFGLASIEGGADLTRPQTVLGTAPYMSPEQIRGERTDRRTDIWSFGCTLFEMSTGRRPFAGEQGRTVTNEILNEDPPRPSSLRSEVPAGLEAVILQCLRKSAAERFPDFQSVSEALRGEKPHPKDAVPSVAVLPFADMSPAKDHDYFGEGLAEELIHALARLQGIRVVARTSAFALKDMKLDVREIGRKLGVGAILEGSVRKAGNLLRVTAQLVDARTGMHLWSERFDREDRDVFDIQDEISLAIVAHLKISLLAGEETALRKRSTTDTEAHNLYLKGLYFMSRPNPESLQKALGFYGAALARDPSFAQAYAATAFAHAGQGILNFALPAEAFPKAKAAIGKALALDADSAEAHAVEAMLLQNLDWDWAAAEACYRRVLALDPSDTMSRGQYAWLLLSLRRTEESLAEIKRALASDPLMPMAYGWSVGIHAAAGRPDEALRDFAKLQEIEPNIGLAHHHAGVAYLRKGMLDEAIAMAEKVRSLVDFAGWSEGFLVVCYARKGDRARAERILGEMLEARKRLPISPASLAWACAALGDLDAAMEWLETAAGEREPLMNGVNVFTEFMAPDLYREPRFRALLDRLKLPR